MKNPTFANRWNADLIDEYYEVWTSNPEALTPEWRAFFEGFELASSRTPAPSSGGTADDGQGVLQSKVIGAIYAFRSIGHTEAMFNPLLKSRPYNARLSLDRLSFSDADLEKSCHTGNYLGGVEMKVSDILDNLRTNKPHTSHTPPHP